MVTPGSPFIHTHTPHNPRSTLSPAPVPDHLPTQYKSTHLHSLNISATHYLETFLKIILPTWSHCLLLYVYVALHPSNNNTKIIILPLSDSWTVYHLYTHLLPLSLKYFSINTCHWVQPILTSLVCPESI